MRLTPDERGVVQRTEAIRWLRKNFQVGAAGVVYFAEDIKTDSIDKLMFMEKSSLLNLLNEIAKNRFELLL